ncbi:oligosaccharide flippase family protein [Paenarthrobacter aurescens]|uniref:Uncharacterized protein n=1 Tax=Paenarthrobacter aurescens TaxID=43663 RepID=A0A4Y3NLE8_PAEAU|nr:oligosaccharide flippase family protein [Paenarthrobacter aurescens]MDO6145570.1 oligosaccharide flippase family protein [Paenarthrobacter aurescens]GEB20016.1 hypothetical protein AAU01_27710 [Paenarthrobacter aurescens]
MRSEKGLKSGLITSAKESHGQRIFYAIAGAAVTPLMSLATAPILAQSLGVLGRGELAAGMAPMLFAVAVGALGIPEALTFHVARHAGGARKVLKRAFWILTFLGMSTAAIVALSASLLSDGNTDIEQLIFITAILTVPTFWASVPNSVLAGNHQWKQAARIDLCLAAVRLLVLSVFAMASLLTPLTAMMVMLGIPLIKGIVMLPYLFAYIRERRNLPPARARLINYGSRLWAGSLAGIVLLRLDQLLMVPFGNAAQLGLYVVAVSLGEIPALLSGAVRNVVFSSDAESSHRPEDQDRLQQTARLTSAATALGSLGIGVALPWAVPLLFGDSFAAAVAVSWVILAGVALGTPGSIAGAGLSARGRPGLRSIGMVIGAVLNTAILLATVPVLGAMGAALATLAGSIVAGTMNIVWLRAHFGMPMRGFFGLRGADFQLILTGISKMTGKKRVHAASK